MSAALLDNRKLLIIPGGCETLGGTLITLIEVAKGFQQLSLSNRIVIMIQSGSLAEKALIDSGCSSCIKSVEADNTKLFAQRSLEWVQQQPITWPLLLDNWTWRGLFPLLAAKGLEMRMKGRPVYHFCHDLSLSRNYLGFLARKVTFACLNPYAICNSNFTASYVRLIMPKIKGILYQPVDLAIFKRSQSQEPPAALKRIIDAGYKIILTPSRLNKPGGVNDKNLRALIPVLAHLKAAGHHYHGVVIGEDSSEQNIHTTELLALAEQCDVTDRFTVLPPSREIERYYQWSNVVLTLAPREPFGRTVVEAIACGIPVIGSRSGGIREILQNFAPDWLVDPQNPAAAAETLVQVVNSPTTPKSIAKGRRWIEDNCSIETYVKGLIQLTELASINDRPISNRQTSLTVSQ